MTSQYGVQTYFFIRRVNEMYMYEVITYKSLYIQGASLKNKSIFSLVQYTSHTLESNVTL